MVGVVGIFVSTRETTNLKSTLLVTLILVFGLVLVCWGFGVDVYMNNLQRVQGLWSASCDFRPFIFLAKNFQYFLLTTNEWLLEFSTRLLECDEAI